MYSVVRVRVNTCILLKNLVGCLDLFKIVSSLSFEQLHIIRVIALLGNDQYSHCTHLCTTVLLTVSLNSYQYIFVDSIESVVFISGFGFFFHSYYAGFLISCVRKWFGD